MPKPGDVNEEAGRRRGEGKPGSFEEQAEPSLRALLASIEIVERKK